MAERFPLLPWLLLVIIATALPQTGRAQDAPNEMPLVVKGLLTDDAHAFNRMTVSLVVCMPGQPHCRRIDNVMVDTGSVGLRLQESALAGFQLPPEKVNGQDVAECFRFVGKNNIWGKVRFADVRLGGLVAAGIPVHVADSGLPRPADGSCPNYRNKASSNGTLGIGRAVLERSGTLYGCNAGECAALPGGTTEALRLPNPVSRLPRDNDGEVFIIPPAPPVSGEIRGLLIFGVNTASNNTLPPDAAILKLDATGRFTTRFNDRNFRSYIDSGTETISFQDDTFEHCLNAAVDYCVQGPENLFSASLSGAAGAAPFENRFRIMRQPGIAGELFDVFSDIVSRNSDPDSFVWGLPFFIGKQVFLVQQGESAPNAGAGPFYAFTRAPAAED